MTIQECLALLATMAGPAFFDLLGLAAIGALIVAVAFEIAGKSTRKAFFDKLGQQISLMGLLLIVVTTIITVVAGAVMASRYQWLLPWFSAPNSPLYGLYASTALLIVFGAIHTLTWKKLRKSKGAHIPLGIVTSVAGLALVTTAVVSVMAMAKAPFEGGVVLPDMQQLQAILISDLPMVFQYLCMAVALGCGIGLVWCILRRNKDDFGRDYYRFALKRAAGVGAVFMVLQVACQGWIFLTLIPNGKTVATQTPFGLVWLAACALALVTAGLWAVLARSQTPMRLKWIAFVGAATSWIMHTCDAAVVMNLLALG